MVLVDASTRESPVPLIERPFVAPEMNPILLLNIVHSVDFRSPVAVAEAYGILKVCTEPVELILKSVPEFPIVNVCVVVESPFREDIPTPARYTHTGAPPLMVRYCPFDPFMSHIVFPTRESPLLKVSTFSFPLKVL